MRRLFTVCGLLILAAVFAALEGCATVQKAPPPIASISTVNTATPLGACIGLKAWSPAEERKLSKDTAAVPPDSLVIAALADYGRMRKAARAACPTAQ